MRNIAPLNLLMRAQVELPNGFRIATEEFRDDWNFSRSVDARYLEKKILRRGWNFIKIADGYIGSGVGETSQEAITSALTRALGGVGTYSNAVKVEHVGLTQYPWFFLARVGVSAYRIQQSAILTMPEEAKLIPIAPRNGRLPRNSTAMSPQFGGGMPQLRQILVLSQGSENRAL